MNKFRLKNRMLKNITEFAHKILYSFYTWLIRRFLLVSILNHWQESPILVFIGGILCE